MLYEFFSCHIISERGNISSVNGGKTMKIVINIFVLSALEKRKSTGREGTCPGNPLSILDIPFGHMKNALKSYSIYTVSVGLIR